MAYTASDLAAIQAAIAKGEIRVRFADRETQYRTMQELLEAEGHISRELAAAAARPRAKQFHAVAVGSGYRDGCKP
jgi:hypothetical protein